MFWSNLQNTSMHLYIVKQNNTSISSQLQNNEQKNISETELKTDLQGKLCVVNSPGCKKTRWSEEEKEKLRTACENHKQQNPTTPINWTYVAQHVHSRTETQCKIKWENSLDPNIKRGIWSKEEIEKLNNAVKNKSSGQGWQDIAKQIPGRTVFQCHTQWTITQNSGQSLTPWTPEEDTKLEQAVNELGTRKWAEVNKRFLGKNRSGCSIRWIQLQRDKAQFNSPNKEAQVLPTQQHPTQPNFPASNHSVTNSPDGAFNFQPAIEQQTGAKRTIHASLPTSPIPNAKRTNATSASPYIELGPDKPFETRITLNPHPFSFPTRPENCVANNGHEPETCTDLLHHSDEQLLPIKFKDTKPEVVDERVNKKIYGWFN